MTTSTTPRRRPVLRWIFLALLIVPIVEVYIIIKVGQAIGGWNTFALIILWSALGAWIVKRESSRSFGALRQAFQQGRMPARELTDTALVLIGGALLLAPGFLTDIIGLFFIAPFTRPLTRRLLEAAVASRLFGRMSVSGFAATSDGRTETYQVFESEPYPHQRRRFARRDDEVIEGEIID